MDTNYIVQHTDGRGGWVTIRGRAAKPHQFSTIKLAEDFLQRRYPVSFFGGQTRTVRAKSLMKK